MVIRYLNGKMMRFFTGLCVSCAIVIAALVIHQQFFPPVTDPGIRQVENWQELELKGQRTGPVNAPVQIVEFFDYECPFCKNAQPAVYAIQEKYSTKVSIIREHFPLSGHEHAFKAAMAAECAALQNQFSSYHELLFSHQEQIGILPYDSLAVAAGIQDIRSFKECLYNQETSSIVQSGHDLANELGLFSIPTFLINGKLFSGAMQKQQLEILVQEALKEQTGMDK